MNNTPVYVGIDIAKDSFQYYITPKLSGSFPNNESGFKRLYKLAGNSPVHLVCEATGGYEQSLADFCLQQGTPLSIVHPGRVRHFIKGKGQRAKNDNIDAQMLALFGTENKPLPINRPLAQQRELRQLSRRREQLCDHRQSFACQSRGLSPQNTAPGRT